MLNNRKVNKFMVSDKANLKTFSPTPIILSLLSIFVLFLGIRKVEKSGFVVPIKSKCINDFFF